MSVARPRLAGVGTFTGPKRGVYAAYDYAIGSRRPVGREVWRAGRGLVARRVPHLGGELF